MIKLGEVGKIKVVYNEVVSFEANSNEYKGEVTITENDMFELVDLYEVISKSKEGDDVANSINLARDYLNKILKVEGVEIIEDRKLAIDLFTAILTEATPSIEKANKQKASGATTGAISKL